MEWFADIGACRAIRVAVVLAAIVVGAQAAHGHGGHSLGAGGFASAGSRLWTLSSGRVHLCGTFVCASDDRVQIRRPDARLVTLRIAALDPPDRAWVEQRRAAIRRANLHLEPEAVADGPAGSVGVDAATYVRGVRGWPGSGAAAVRLADASGATVAPQQGRAAPEVALAFQHFVKAGKIQTRWDDRYFYVASRGIPDHPMMIGIRSWQQQVPLPQPYVGDNAWQIPLDPVPAAQPISAQGRFLRGAIALAVNGIPIFNPLNNRGDDAYLFGELDEFGGHCGRADDYHYHIAPVHLEQAVGRGAPLAYALDGYPIFGYDEPDGSIVSGLDAINGHADEKGRYHYHATKSYPYLNGGFHAVVTERDGQVDPQPRAQPVRPDLRPLRGARITDFRRTAAGSFELTYDVNGAAGSVQYAVASDGSVDFTFKEPDGTRYQRTYAPRRERGRGAGRPDPGADGPLQQQSSPPAPRGARDITAPGETPSPVPSRPRLVVSSPAFAPGGAIPAEYTCDGEGSSPPVTWSGAPAGTVSFALCLWHVAPDREKSYWVVYDIPASSHGLERNDSTTGVTGRNDKDRLGYEPMCSRGPGPKTYHLTVYALSRKLGLPPEETDRARLVEAIGSACLAEGTLDFQYTRPDR